ncbi:MAG: hypothetical protein SCARUB_02831 [Candidatus Scalindua rubra]|uniref:Uncharacterized protein n=1 Tax=Candidatus Scalindua rubra TaxID=1872076 RepID=A0A1E3X8V1_9BACT|nr:MAG: hypothetical protein SCARUB_02831 [Candidatus Scalindua rubra]
MKKRDLCDFCGGELEHKVVDVDLHIQNEMVLCEGLLKDSLRMNL